MEQLVNAGAVGGGIECLHRVFFGEDGFLEVAEVDGAERQAGFGLGGRGLCGVFQHGERLGGVAALEVVLRDIDGEGGEAGVDEEDAALVCERLVGALGFLLENREHVARVGFGGLRGLVAEFEREGFGKFAGDDGVGNGCSGGMAQEQCSRKDCCGDALPVGPGGVHG